MCALAPHNFSSCSHFKFYVLTTTLWHNYHRVFIFYQHYILFLNMYCILYGSIYFRLGFEFFRQYLLLQFFPHEYVRFVVIFQWSFVTNSGKMIFSLHLYYHYLKDIFYIYVDYLVWFSVWQVLVELQLRACNEVTFVQEPANDFTKVYKLGPWLRSLELDLCLASTLPLSYILMLLK